MRRHFVFPTEELLERRRRIAFGDVSFATLDPSDTLLHLCFHAADGGGDRLGWLADIHRAVVVGRPPVEHRDRPGTRVARGARGGDHAGANPPRARDAGTRSGDPGPAAAGVARRPCMCLDRAFPVAPSTRRWGNPASLLTRGAAGRAAPLDAVGHAAVGVVHRGRSSLRTRSIERKERTQVGGAEPRPPPRGRRRSRPWRLSRRGGTLRRSAHASRLTAASVRREVPPRDTHRRAFCSTRRKAWRAHASEPYHHCSVNPSDRGRAVGRAHRHDVADEQFGLDRDDRSAGWRRPRSATGPVDSPRIGARRSPRRCRRTPRSRPNAAGPRRRRPPSILLPCGAPWRTLTRRSRAARPPRVGAAIGPATGDPSSTSRDFPYASARLRRSTKPCSTRCSARSPRAPTSRRASWCSGAGPWRCRAAVPTRTTRSKHSGTPASACSSIRRRTRSVPS